MRILCATGRHELDEAVVAWAGRESVREAHYLDAAWTALSEASLDAATVGAALPGGDVRLLLSALAARGTSVLWLPGAGRRSGRREARAIGARAVLPEPVRPQQVVDHLVRWGIPGHRVAGSRARCGPAGDAVRVREAPVRPWRPGVYAVIGSVPRVGTTTAAAALALAAVEAGVDAGLLDADPVRPGLAGVLGLPLEGRGWDGARDEEEFAAAGRAVGRLLAWPLQADPGRRERPELWPARLEQAVRWASRIDRSLLVLDCGCPRPVVDGVADPRLLWLVAAGAHLGLVTADDPAATSACGRLLRTLRACGGRPEACWVAAADPGPRPPAWGRDLPWHVVPWDRPAMVRAAVAREPPPLRLAWP